MIVHTFTSAKVIKIFNNQQIQVTNNLIYTIFITLCSMNLSNFFPETDKTINCFS